MVACGPAGGTQGRGPGRLATWGRVSGQRSARWLAEECRGAWGSRGRTGMGDPAGPTVPGAGAESCAQVSRPGGAAAGLFLLGGICRMCSRWPSAARKFCFLFFLSFRSQRGRERAGWGAGPGRGGGAADGVVRGRGAPGAAGVRAGWARAAGRFWAAAELWGECLSPALEAPRRGNRCMRRQSRREGHFGGVD